MGAEHVVQLVKLHIKQLLPPGAKVYPVEQLAQTEEDVHVTQLAIVLGQVTQLPLTKKVLVAH